MMTNVEYMQHAIRLASKGIYTTDPNPSVGCVIVKDGEIVGEGWHQRAGEGHAEINALQAAGAAAKGATAYVTLEPCSHHGKTPPCVEALIDAGVADVVVGIQDPNPDVNGRGIAALEKAGIPVRTGVLKEQVERQLSGFLSRVTTGRPFVRLKMACSIDGCIAMASGQSEWGGGGPGGSAPGILDEVRVPDEFMLPNVASMRASSTDWRRSCLTRSSSDSRSCLRTISGSLVRKRTRLPGVSEICSGGGPNAGWVVFMNLQYRPPAPAG